VEGPRALMLAASFLRWGWPGVVLPLCSTGRGGRAGAGPRGVRRDEASRRHRGGTSRKPACVSGQSSPLAFGHESGYNIPVDQIPGTVTSK
jgi:hypothetical protein